MGQVSKRAGWGRNEGRKETFFLSLPMPRFHFLALVPLFAQPKPKIPFLCLSLLRNQTETLAIQARAHTCTVYDICQQLQPIHLV